MDEVHCCDFHIGATIMSRLLEMFPYIGQLTISNVGPMALESVHESVFGLSHVLLIAHSACDAVDQVGALACDIPHGRVGLSSECALDSTREVQLRAISAVVPLAPIAVFAAWCCSRRAY